MLSQFPEPPLLLDTSVLSLFFKRNTTRAVLYEPDLRGKRLAVCFVTIAEIHRWAILHHWGQARIAKFEEALGGMVILPSNDEVSRHWALIQSSTQRSANDAWIAACALTYGCTLVTDDNDFHGIQGLSIISHVNEGR